MWVGEIQTRCATSRMGLEFARTESDVEAALRLRYRVFVEEQGAQIDAPHPGIEQDRFDHFCAHLIVRDRERGEVVGTYRLLAPEGAAAAGGYYSEQEFDLARLRYLRPSLVELGRACVHPDYRSGAVISMLWSGVAQYLELTGHRYLFGCASLGMQDGGITASRAWRQLAGSHLAPRDYRVFPLSALRLRPGEEGGNAIPPLLAGYIRLGAFVCGEPAWDPDFNTADIPVLLPMARLQRRYAKHFYGGLRGEGRRASGIAA